MNTITPLVFWLVLEDTRHACVKLQICPFFLGIEMKKDSYHNSWTDIEKENVVKLP